MQKYPQMRLVGLLIEKQKLNTAGSCVEEEMFHFAKRFLHLIQVGRYENE